MLWYLATSGKSSSPHTYGVFSVLTYILVSRAMGMNEKVYKNPSVFDPSRFVPKADGNHEPFFNQFAFGFGRR